MVGTRHPRVLQDHHQCHSTFRRLASNFAAYALVITSKLTSTLAYWIAFGPHGPRAMPPPGEGFKVFLYTMYGIAASGVLFGTARYFARGPPPTFTKEHQEASNVYMKVRHTSPSCESEGGSWFERRWHLVKRKEILVLYRSLPSALVM